MNDKVNIGFTPVELAAEQQAYREEQERISAVLSGYENICADNPKAMQERILSLALELKTAASVYETDKLSQIIYQHIEKHYSGSIPEIQWIEWVKDAIKTVADFSRKELTAGLPKDEPDEDLDEVLKYQPFPIDVLPSILREWTIETSKAEQVDYSVLACPAFSMLSGINGAAVQVEIHSEYRQPVIIWTANLSESGTNKTGALSKAAAPLYSLQGKLYEQFRNDYLEWKEREAQREKGQPQENPPLEKDVLTDDTTTEALAGVLQAYPSCNLILPEMSGWYGSFGCYNKAQNKDLAFYLKTFDGGTLSIKRKTGAIENRSIFIKSGSIAITGMLQPDVYRRIMNKNENLVMTEDGLDARILFSMPPDRQRKLQQYKIPSYVKKDYTELFNKFYELQNRYDTENPLILRLSAAAYNVFNEYYNENEANRHYETKSAVRYIYPKLTSYAARLAGMFHLIENIDVLDTHYEISADVMRRTVELCRWYENEKLRTIDFLSGLRIDGGLTPEQRAVMKVLRKADCPETIYEMKRRGRAIRKIENLETVLCELTDLGIVNKNIREGTGRDGREITEFSILESVAVAKPQKNFGKIGGCSNSNSEHNEKNGNSAVPLPAEAYSDFAGYQNAGSIIDCENDDESGDGYVPEVNEVNRQFDETADEIDLTVPDGF